MKIDHSELVAAIRVAEETFAHPAFRTGGDGPGRGNWGHAGRPGQVGGSAPRDDGGSKSGAGEGVPEHTLPPEVQAQLKRPPSDYKPANPDAKDTQGQYKRPDGTYTPERAALHKAIVEKYLNGITPVKEPVATIIGGGMASGKSTLVKQEGLAKDNTVSVNVDLIRADLPEYREKLAEAAKSGKPTGVENYHEEASDVSAMLLKEAAKRSMNLTLDGTGNTTLDKLGSKISAMRAAGLRVKAEYVTVPVEEAIKRADHRAQTTDRRYVPHSAMYAVHSAVSDILPKAIQAGLFDSARLWDTRGPLGSKAKLVISSSGKDITVHDPQLWDEFRAKAKEVYRGAQLRRDRNDDGGDSDRQAAVTHHAGSERHALSADEGDRGDQAEGRDGRSAARDSAHGSVAEGRLLAAAAVAGDIRTATYDGADHIVVPVVALVEGVIHAVNAPKPELVLAEEFSVGYLGWNGRPVVPGHPVRNGIQVSANDPLILEEEAVGQVFNARLDGKRLLMEAWINPVKAERSARGRALMARVREKKPIEVSVGTFVLNEPRQGRYNEKPYSSVWRQIIPDHLALLPEGTTGACSIEMGCGAFRPAQGIRLEANLHEYYTAMAALADGDALRAAEEVRAAKGEPSVDKDAHPFTYCMDVVVPAIERKKGSMEDPKAFCGWWKAQRNAADWDESKHPRAEDGKFSDGGGNGSSSGDLKPETKDSVLAKSGSLKKQAGAFKKSHPQDFNDGARLGAEGQPLSFAVKQSHDYIDGTARDAFLSGYLSESKGASMGHDKDWKGSGEGPRSSGGGRAQEGFGGTRTPAEGDRVKVMGKVFGQGKVGTVKMTAPSGSFHTVVDRKGKSIGNFHSSDLKALEDGDERLLAASDDAEGEDDMSLEEMQAEHDEHVAEMKKAADAGDDKKAAHHRKMADEIKGKMASMRASAGFDESQHPRDKDGQFTESSGGGGGSAADAGGGGKPKGFTRDEIDKVDSVASKGFNAINSKDYKVRGKVSVDDVKREFDKVQSDAQKMIKKAHESPEDRDLALHGAAFAYGKAQKLANILEKAGVKVPRVIAPWSSRMAEGVPLTLEERAAAAELRDAYGMADDAEEQAELIGYQTMASMLGQAFKALTEAGNIVKQLVADEETEAGANSFEGEAAETTLEQARLRAVVAQCSQAMGSISGVQQMAYGLLGPAPVNTVAGYEGKTEDPVAATATSISAAHRAAAAAEPACACKAGQTNEGVVTMEKSARIKALIDCKSTPWTAADQSYLEAQSDERLTALEANAKTAAENAVNAEKADAAIKAAEEARAAAERVPTEEEYLAKAPESVKQIVASHKAAQAARKDQLVGALKVAQSAITEDQLQAKSLDELEELARFAQSVTPAKIDVDFSGRATPRAAAAADDSTVPPPPDVTSRILQMRGATAAKA